MNIAVYSHLAVLEKALRQQPLSVGERRIAAHLASQARAAANQQLLTVALG